MAGHCPAHRHQADDRLRDGRSPSRSEAGRSPRPLLAGNAVAPDRDVDVGGPSSYRRIRCNHDFCAGHFIPAALNHLGMVSTDPGRPRRLPTRPVSAVLPQRTSRRSGNRLRRESAGSDSSGSLPGPYFAGSSQTSRRRPRWAYDSPFCRRYRRPPKVGPSADQSLRQMGFSATVGTERGATAWRSRQRDDCFTPARAALASSTKSSTRRRCDLAAAAGPRMVRTRPTHPQRCLGSGACPPGHPVGSPGG